MQRNQNDIPADVLTNVLASPTTNRHPSCEILRYGQQSGPERPLLPAWPSPMATLLPWLEIQLALRVVFMDMFSNKASGVVVLVMQVF